MNMIWFVAQGPQIGWSMGYFHSFTQWEASVVAAGAQQSSMQESIFLSDMEIPLCVKGLKQPSPSNSPKSPSWRQVQLKMDRAIVTPPCTIHRYAVTHSWVLAKMKMKAKAAGGGTDPAPPDITLKEEATVAKVGRAAQAAGHLPILLHDLDHLTHGCRGTEGAMMSLCTQKCSVSHPFQSG